MFLTSTGFSIDMHFCGNHLKSFSLTGKAKNCFELAKTSKCAKHQQTEVATPECEMSKKDCCHNKTLVLQADLTPDIPANDLIISPQLQDFLVAYVAVFLKSILPNERHHSSFAHYKPPLILRDIPVLVQSFLI